MLETTQLSFFNFLRAVASRQNWDSCNSQLLMQGESIPEPILFKDIISLHNNALDCQIVENLW